MRPSGTRSSSTTHSSPSSSPICSAALAAAEISDAYESGVLIGYIVGVETAYRVGHSTDPAHYQNGWLCLDTIESIGLASASASVLYLN